ncbi:MAG: hypothetical protein Q8L98_06650 [Chlamydiales bacterium]|nr:hypothetical protein [Chlamydiales bacterium]
MNQKHVRSTLWPAKGIDQAGYLEFIVEFLNNPVDSDQNLALFFKAAMYSLAFLATSDPCNLHYQAAREILREVGGEQLESQEKARDLLARSLVRECQVFASHFIPFDSSIVSEKTIFTEEGSLGLDKMFAEHLASLGSYGKKMSAALLMASKAWGSLYRENQNVLSLFRLWVDFDIPPYYCRYLKLLAEILWKDRVEAQFLKDQKHVPALTLTVQRPLIRLFSSCTQMIVQQEKMMISHEGSIVAETVSTEPKYAALLAKGIKSFGSIYHHKLFRYECEMGYNNWIEGKPDPHVIRFERGETEIAEMLGFKFKQAPSIIKSLLHLQSHMTFHFDDQSSGHLISLKEFKSQTTSREQGLEIALSAQLMPYYTFQTDRKGRLLVPMAKFPPFVSAPQYHAGQALLQMLIMEEFTRQSILFSHADSIEIPEEKWQEFCKSSGLPVSVFKQVRYRWLSDGEDGFRFLVQVAKNKYTLGESYMKECQFLRAQGAMRKERQLQAQIAVRKKQSLLPSLSA